MSRAVDISRAEAEYLVGLLESVPKDSGEHYLAHDIAAEIRGTFGMSPAAGSLSKRQLIAEIKGEW